MDYPIELISEQIEMLTDEFRFADGEELVEIKIRLTECIKAIRVLKQTQSPQT